MSKLESWHLFVAPIFLELKKERKFNSLEEQAVFLKNIIQKESLYKFKEKRFSAKTPQDYSNFQYFYDDVRRSIFWYEEKYRSDDGAVLFRLNVSDEAYIKTDPCPIAHAFLDIYGKTENPAVVERKLELDLMDIDIAFYQFDVGHVSFLYRYVQEDVGLDSEDSFYKNILTINDRVRRLYLPWLANKLMDTDSFELSERITVQLQGGGFYHQLKIKILEEYKNPLNKSSSVIKEDFAKCLRFEELNVEDPNRPVVLETALGKMDNLKNNISFELLDDNRMFSATFIQTKSLPIFLQSGEWGEIEEFSASRRWYRLMACDGYTENITALNDGIRKKTVLNSTYTRWLDSEYPEKTTLYACTKNSFVQLGSADNVYYATVLKTSFLNQYTEMIRLVLAQATAVHHFGRVIYSLSGKVMMPRKKLTSHGLDERVFKEVSLFRQAFNDYINRLFFREVSPQIQGSELYKMMQDKLQVYDHLSELRGEINELSNHVEMLQRQSQEKSIHQLTQTSIVLGVTAVVAGIYGANFISMENGHMIVDPKALVTFGLVMVCAMIGASFAPTLSSITFTIGNALRRLFRMI